MAADRQNLILIGYMGTGKSTVSKKLSHLVKRECIEMDTTIERKAGMPIPDIFKNFGETYFRDLESEILESVLEKDNLIISCGGGIVLRDGNIRAMKRGGKTILLTASPETVYGRLKDSSSNRPLLKDDISIAHIEKMMQARQARYLLARDIEIATDGKAVKEIAEEIIVLLGL